jgi:hypothetical protein
MSQLSIRFIPNYPPKSMEEMPFKVLYNYRKTKLLRKIR